MVSLNDLPDVILALILSHIGSRERMKCLTTCKSLAKAAVMAEAWQVDKAMSFYNLRSPSVSSGLLFLNTHQFIQHLHLHSDDPMDLYRMLKSLHETPYLNQGIKSLRISLHQHVERETNWGSLMMKALSNMTGLMSLRMSLHLLEAIDLVLPARYTGLRKLKSLSIVERVHADSEVGDMYRLCTVMLNNTHKNLVNLQKVVVVANCSDVLDRAQYFKKLVSVRYDTEIESFDSIRLPVGARMDALCLSIPEDASNNQGRIMHQLGKLESVRDLKLICDGSFRVDGLSEVRIHTLTIILRDQEAILELEFESIQALQALSVMYEPIDKDDDLQSLTSWVVKIIGAPFSLFMEWSIYYCEFHLGEGGALHIEPSHYDL